MELESSLAPTDTPKGSVLIAHGFGEHHGRYASFKKALNDAGYDAWFFNFTGHGPGAKNPATADVGALIGEHLEARKALMDVKRPGPVYLFGHSMGGLITLASEIIDPTAVQAVAVTGPALMPMTEIPLAVLKMVVPFARLFPGLKSVQLDDALLSSDPQVAVDYRNDPHVYQGKVPVLTGATMAIQGNQTIKNAQILARPTLILHGDADGLANVQGSMLFAQASPDYTTLELVEGGYHELLNEPDHADFEERIIDWYNQWR